MNDDSSKFCTLIAELITAVDNAFKSQEKRAALILFYSSIDIISSLTRPISQDSTNGEVLRSWVKKYMLADTHVCCHDMDIWGARCGILHTMTAQSDKSRQQKARQIGYVGSKDAVDFLQKKIDPKKENHIFVYVNDLVLAFIDGTQRFSLYVLADAQLQATAFHHSRSLLSATQIQNPE